MVPSAIITVGELGPALLSRYPGNVRVTHSTPGIDFYEMAWPPKEPGKVRVAYVTRSIVISHVLGVQAPQELGDLRSEGLNDVSVRAGITDPELINHDEARTKFFDLLGTLLSQGWRQVIDRSQPRLQGEERMRYTFATSNLNGLDARYVPNLANWLRIENGTPWSFYADGLYLDVSFRRDPTKMDPSLPGAYLLRFNIKTEDEYFRGYVGPSNRSRWKEEISDILTKVAAMRNTSEAELKSRGAVIDTSYRDPPLPKAK